MKNVEILEEIVGTQYNDMEGLISIDAHSGNDLFTLCEDNGIDMEKYFLFGFGLSEFTTDGIGEQDEVTCSVLLLDKEEHGQSFDEIQSNIEGLETVNVIKKTFDIKYIDLGKYIKRFDFMTVSEMSKSISSMNIVE